MTAYARAADFPSVLLGAIVRRPETKKTTKFDPFNERNYPWAALWMGYDEAARVATARLA